MNGTRQHAAETKHGRTHPPHPPPHPTHKLATSCKRTIWRAFCRDGPARPNATANKLVAPLLLSTEGRRNHSSGNPCLFSALLWKPLCFTMNQGCSGDAKNSCPAQLPDGNGRGNFDEQSREYFQLAAPVFGQHLLPQKNGSITTGTMPANNHAQHPPFGRRRSPSCALGARRVNIHARHAFSHAERSN